jgi:hypothetical protein
LWNDEDIRHPYRSTFAGQSNSRLNLAYEGYLLSKINLSQTAPLAAAI